MDEKIIDVAMVRVCDDPICDSSASAPSGSVCAMRPITICIDSSRFGPGGICKSPVRRIALPTRDVPRGVRELESNGPLVGVMEDIDWEVGEVPLAPGDRVVVYTDGISEARSMTQGMLGRKRFLEMMSWNQQLELSTYTRRLVREVDEFREGLPASDDVTLMATEY